jgi:hypothetical protein
MVWVALVLGIISAIAWIAAAVITPDLSKSYYGGPPPAIARRVRVGSVCNAVGAFSAGLAMAAQAWITWASMAQ